MIKTYYIAAILVGLACISMPAMAFTSATKPLYVGGSAGAARFSDTQRSNIALLTVGAGFKF